MRLLVLLGVCVGGLLQGASAPPLPRMALEGPLDQPVLARIITASGRPAQEMAIRIPVDLDGTDAASDPGEGRLAAYEALGVRLWPVVALPADQAGAADWRTRLQQWLSRHRGHLSVLELRIDAQPPSLVRFAVQAAATDLHAGGESDRLAIGGTGIDPDSITSLLDTNLAPYVDLIAAPSADSANRALDAVRTSAPAVRAVLVGQQLPADPEASRAALIDLQVSSLGSRIVSIAAGGEPRAVEAAFAALAPLTPLLNGEVEAIDPAASSLRLRAGDEDVTATVPHRLLFENRTFGMYLFYAGPEHPTPLEVTLNVPIEGLPVVHDLERRAQAPAIGYRRDGQTVHVQAPRTGRPMLLDFNADASEVFAARGEVAAERLLSVREIIANHRRQQAAQDLVLEHYAATMRMEQHFRPTAADAGYDVVTENRFYSGRDGTEWEERSFSVNGSHWGANRPPFPLLQAEKVLSLPLQLQFGDDYRYRLDGVERTDGFDCYVVSFNPVEGLPSRYRGRVWIDRRTFARIKVQAVQTHLSAPVVSNEEVQHFRPVTEIAGRPVFLFSGLTAQQIVLVAGRNLLVEKSITFGEFVVNGRDFDAARQSARSGDAIMYRETDNGLRYYVKLGRERVISDRSTTKAKALAMGVTIDPSYAFPLPIFGINYLNFALAGRQDSQLAMLFAGVLAAINIQRPKIAHTPFDASIDLFGIAVPSSDRVHGSGGERPGERVITWPETAGLNLGWQYTAFQKATLQYQLRFDGYHADTTTVEAFQTPSSTITNGIGGAYEYRRKGYSLVANGAWYDRATWKPWGLVDAALPGGGLAPPLRDYARYSAGLSKDLFLGVFQKLHFNAAYFGGRRLDRFSRYQFGLFDDTRIHGVPASGLRFDELAMVRSSYTFNIFEQYRIDLFLERAVGRDRDIGRAWQSLTGTGIALNVRAPFGTILRADVGHSLLPARYRGIGSTVVQIMFLKPLGGP